ncbi:MULTISPECIES: hypothetical protein [Clavibacter]|uniref:Uncharacterized protein n=1 Tax=Clavibacter tessellarius TaxID=31965 RepID=A0A154V2E9_9MICO|nr:hypothetical protein [Clavibacter michiganensis]KZC95354.1 hypothetical protein AWH51_08650 [Clavibacter michiganensis subsp. tessellarius]
MTHHDGTDHAHDDATQDDAAGLGGEGTIPAGSTGVAAGHDGGNDHFEPEEDTPHRTDEDGAGATA